MSQIHFFIHENYRSLPMHRNNHLDHWRTSLDISNFVILHALLVFERLLQIRNCKCNPSSSVDTTLIFLGTRVVSVPFSKMVVLSPRNGCRMQLDDEQLLANVIRIFRMT